MTVWLDKLRGFMGFVNGTQVTGSGRVLKLNFVGAGITSAYNTLTGLLTFDFSGLSGGGPVAKAGGQVTGDGSSYELADTLYTVPTGKAGLYRATMFCGPATTGGSGQVHVRVDPWGEYAPGTGNLAFMSPKNSDDADPGINPVLPSTEFLIGEGSEVQGPETFAWWADVGAEIDYLVQVNAYDDGDFVWMTSLEYLGPN